MRSTQSSLLFMVIAIVLAALTNCSTISAGTLQRHSFSHQLAAGDLDGDGAAEVAWIVPSGDILAFNPSTNMLQTLAGAQAYAVAAGDIDLGGNGSAELLYLRDAPHPTISGGNQIRAYSVMADTDTLYEGAAHPSSVITAGDWNDDGDDGIVVSGPTGNLFGSETTGGGIVYDSPNDLGYLASWVAADVVPVRSGQEFTGFNPAGVHYSYDGGTSGTYSATGAFGLDAISAGNVNAVTDGDEIIALSSGTELWEWDQGDSWVRLPGAGVGVGAGLLYATSNDGLEEWLAIGTAPDYNLFRFEGNSVWQQVGMQGDWGDFVAADLDGDGLDEVLALKRSGEPFLFDPDLHSDFQPLRPIPEPSTFALAALGLLGLLGCGHRRKR